MADKNIAAVAAKATPIAADSVLGVDSTDSSTKRFTHSSLGLSHTHTDATSGADGFMSAADKVKVDALAAKIAPGRPLIVAGTPGYTVPNVPFISEGNVLLVVDNLRYAPFIIQSDIAIDQLAVDLVTAGTAGCLIRLGLYAADINWQPTTRMVDAGTVAGDGAAGIRSITLGSPLALPAGRYLTVLTTNGTPTAPTLRARRGDGGLLGLVAALGASAFVNSLRKSTAYAALTDPGTAWNTIGSGGVPMEHVVFMRISTP